MAEKEKQFKHYPVDVKVRNFCGKSKLFFLLTLILVVIAIALPLRAWTLHWNSRAVRLSPIVMRAKR